MSQRVPYLVGNIKGRDVQNWPTKTRAYVQSLFGGLSSAFMDANFPVDITVAQLLAITLRVKKWTLSGGGSGSIHFAPALGAPHDLFATATITGPAAVYSLWDSPGEPKIGVQEKHLLSLVFGPSDGVSTRELELIHLPGAGFGEVSDYPLIGYAWNNTAGGGTSGSGSYPWFPNNLLLNDWYVLFDVLGPTFAPGMFVSGRAPDTGSPDFISFPKLRFDADRNPVTSFSFSPLGFVSTVKDSGTMVVSSGIEADFTIPMQVQFVGGGLDSVSGTAACAFVLTAAEFWPYQNSLGQPIYDTADGHIINDPLS